ncbi:ARM repeat-containing protein [Piedraia hortae CBS 480.64]|uniref:ARM repeat-containing protein n=1 Tax=Piedraia hortae CBS 480.64 TaxID=1314780 RepID=A0A6A7BXR2_9PEZI|nr:ARM repeat-containing protein [Piedraia hortae CBS 480.64]
MATTEKEVAALLRLADEAKTSRDWPRLGDILTQASRLEPENKQVKQRWRDFQASDQGALGPCQKYLSSEKGEDGKRALSALRENQLEDVQEVYDLLLEADNKLSMLGDLTSTLLQRQPAKKYAAGLLEKGQTQSLTQTLHQGEKPFRALVGITFEDAVWTSRNTQKTAQQHVFRFCVASLKKPDENKASLIEAVARQLAIHPDNVKELINQDVSDTIFSMLDFRLDSSVRGQAMVCTTQLFKLKDNSEQMFTTFIKSMTGKDPNITASAAAMAFAVVPAAAAQIFLTEGFIQHLVSALENNTSAVAAGKTNAIDIERAILELLSAACIDKACREAINRRCSSYLQKTASQAQNPHQALASIILAKSSEKSADSLTETLSNLAIKDDEAIEGLAYTSLQPSVKEKLSFNTKLLQQLITTVKSQNQSSFGALQVLSNLVTYRRPRSAERTKISQLKAYASGSSIVEDSNPLDDDVHVSARCTKLVNLNIIPTLTSLPSTNTSSASLTVKILLSLSKDTKNRPKLAQQGGIKYLLHVPGGSLTSAHALARILISTNPEHAFTKATPAVSAASALIKLLIPVEDENGESDLLPTFESLLALTNLCSTEDSASRDLVLRTAMPQVEELLLSNNTLIQRAAVELICNLMLSPDGVALFTSTGSSNSKDTSKSDKSNAKDPKPANPRSDPTSSPTNRRLGILVALSNSPDTATRRAAGGALAGLTQWDVGVGSLLNDKGVSALIRMCHDESPEVRHRGLVCVLNAVSAPGEVGKHAIEVFKKQHLEGSRTEEEVLREVRDEIRRRLR